MGNIYTMSSVVLSRKEIERMKASVLPPVEDRRAQMKKTELREKSQERLKHWPNTLEAVRKKKESFLQEKEAKAEEVRQKIDREEAEFRRENRLKTIQKANDLIYEQTDKMKMLKSQKLYSEALHTRTFQIIEKEKRFEEELAIDAKFHQDTLEQIRRGDEVDRGKERKAKEMIDKIKMDRAEQLLENRQRKEKIKKAEYEEGQKMKREAKERLEEELRQLEEKQKMIIEANFKTLDAQKKDKLLKETMIKAEQDAIAARDAEVWKIEKRQKEIKDRKQLMFDESQKVRMMMIDRAVEQLKQQSNKEETILAKQIQDKKDADDRALFEKEEKIRLEWEATVESRTAQLRRKMDEKAKQKAIDDALALKFKNENEEAIALEKKKVEDARAEQTRIKMIQLEEGKRVNKEKSLKAELEKEENKFLLSLAGHEDQRFSEQCKNEIESFVVAGKPIYPLIKALEFTQPPLLAAKTVKVIREKKEE